MEIAGRHRRRKGSARTNRGGAGPFRRTTLDRGASRQAPAVATLTSDDVAAMMMLSRQDRSSSGERRALFRKFDCLQISCRTLRRAGVLSRRVRSPVDLAHRHRRGLADRRQQDGDRDPDRTPAARRQPDRSIRRCGGRCHRPGWTKTFSFGHSISQSVAAPS